VDAADDSGRRGDRRRFRARAGDVVVSIPVLATGAMGLLKLLDLPRFAGAVPAWGVVPRAAVPPATVAVPRVEVGLAAAWLAGLGRRGCAAAILGMILVYTVVYTGLLSSGPPPCGCLGVLAERFATLEHAEQVLGRNAALLGLLVAGLVLSGNPRGRRSAAPGAQAGRCPRPTGFTLVETIVVVAGAAVLVALLLPALAGVRQRGREAASRANLRQHAAVLGAYGLDHRDLFPYLTDPHATVSVIRCETAGVAMTVQYFVGSDYWWLGLADGYYGGNWRSPAFRSPLAPSYLVAGSYTMPCSFIADPAYYTPEGRQDPPRQLRPTGGYEVLLPAHKSLVVDNSILLNAEVLGPAAGSVQAATVDGAAAAFDAARTRRWQHHTGDGPYPDFGSHFPALVPMTHAREGVRGRDDG
jgi:competence protein ComGC